MACDLARAFRLSQRVRRNLVAPLQLALSQIRCLLHHTDARLVWFCVALLTFDAFFMAMFSAHSIYRGLYQESSPILGDEWHIGADWSYSEMLGYLKMMIIIFLFVSIWLRWRRPLYLALAAIFVFALLDDAFQAHERVGSAVVDAFGLRPFAGLRAIDFGELVVWTAIGVPLLGAAFVAFRKSPPNDRGNGLLLLAAFAVLVLFAVIADMLHILVRGTFRGSDLLFTVIEDGGEQITLSVICGLAVLIYREVRSREPRGAAQ